MPNANRDKGIRCERDVAAYYRSIGLLKAERRVTTGWHGPDRHDPDQGDGKGVPGICTQCKDVVKSHPRGLAGKALADVMAETEEQRVAMGAALGILVEKRPQNGQVGTWWAHLPANVYLGLVGGLDPCSPVLAELTYPVRTELRHIAEALVRFSALCDIEGIAA